MNMIPPHRLWMYDRLHENRMGIKSQYYTGVESFCHVVETTEQFIREGRVRCPCNSCKRCCFLDVQSIRYHLYKYGFEPHYWIWTDHGEVDVNNVNHLSKCNCDVGTTSASGQYESNLGNQFEQMVDDAIGHQFEHDWDDDDDDEQEPNTDARDFYALLDNAKTPLWEGCVHSKLSLAVRMLAIKSESTQSQRSFDQWLSLIKEVCPPNTDVPTNFYEAKIFFSKLGLKAIKIDCCSSGCMLFYKDDAGLNACKFCGKARFKPRRVGPGRYKDIPVKRMHYLPLIPRLKRLFASMSSAPHMTWHHENKRTDGLMLHPSHGEAWAHFDNTYPDFASEPRNVRLALCSDGFTPNNQFSKPYSCWPVIVTPYNLPPEMCMKDPYLFLSCVIPGPENPKAKIDVFLQPLIDELNELWETGVWCYDVSRKKNFNLRACLMWTINDFPAYGMLSGWTTQGRLACPICMEDTRAFRLKNGGKNSWFDCHRVFLEHDHQFRRNRYGFKSGKIENDEAPVRLTGREVWMRVRRIPKITETGGVTKIPGYGKEHNWTKQSIFWELPYWKDNLVRHCLDVMHIEKNVFDNIMHTVMDTDQTKDNEKARLDLAIYCKKPELNLQPLMDGRWLKPKACYTLSKRQIEAVLKWLQELKLPDGCSSTLGKCVNVRQGRLVGMKSHDCHVFMQCLLPIAFKELPKAILNPLIDLSQFFRDLCSSTIKVEDLLVMERNIPIILCTLERVLPPAFFDSMEHLPVHLPYEARMCGPVQYRWMYPFERCMGVFKRSVKNRAHVEGSICEAFLTKETSNFCSYYFGPNVTSSRTRVSRNDEGAQTSNTNHSTLSIFNVRGRAAGKPTDHWLTDQEKCAAHLVVLLNCDEVTPLYGKFKEELGDQATDQIFPSWFASHVQTHYFDNDDLMSLSWGPLNKAVTWPIYYVNGYKFHTADWGRGQNKNNSGVWVKGEYSNTNGTNNNDWYGVLQKVIQIQYMHRTSPNCVNLFFCEWYDPSHPQGTRIHKRSRMVEINPTRKYRAYDPFIIAHNARQVYYIPYPASGPSSWRVVMKTKPSGKVEVHEEAQSDTNDLLDNDEAFQINDPNPARLIVEAPIPDDLQDRDAEDEDLVVVHLPNNRRNNQPQDEEDDEQGSEEDASDDEEDDFDDDDIESDHQSDETLHLSH